MVGAGRILVLFCFNYLTIPSYGSCVALSTATFGQNFSFKGVDAIEGGTSYMTTLPDINDEGFTGNWTDGDQSMDYVAFAQTYDSALAGTWERETEIYYIEQSNGIPDGEANATAGVSDLWEWHGIGVYRDEDLEAEFELGEIIATPTREGHTFLGYYTGENGTGTELIDKEGLRLPVFSNTYFGIQSNNVDENDVGHLYARWRADSSFYEVLTSDGTLYFIQSQDGPTGSGSAQTITDIDDASYTGTVWTLGNFMEIGLAGDVPWNAMREDIKNVVTYDS